MDPAGRSAAEVSDKHITLGAIVVAVIKRVAVAVVVRHTVAVSGADRFVCFFDVVALVKGAVTALACVGVLAVAIVDVGAVTTASADRRVLVIYTVACGGVQITLVTIVPLGTGTVVLGDTVAVAGAHVGVVVGKVAVAFDRVDPGVFSLVGFKAITIIDVGTIAFAATDRWIVGLDAVAQVSVAAASHVEVAVVAGTVVACNTVAVTGADRFIRFFDGVALVKGALALLAGVRVLAVAVIGVGAVTATSADGRVVRLDTVTIVAVAHFSVVPLIAHARVVVARGVLPADRVAHSSGAVLARPPVLASTGIGSHPEPGVSHPASHTHVSGAVQSPWSPQQGESHTGTLQLSPVQSEAQTQRSCASQTPRPSSYPHAAGPKSCTTRTLSIASMSSVWVLAPGCMKRR